MPAARSTFTLSLLPKVFAICKLPADSAVPQWAAQGSFCSVTRTSDELSIVAEFELVPEDIRPEIVWRILKVRGPFDLSVVGVLASLVAPLAEAGLSVFTVSTFDTDYLLTQTGQLHAAVDALRRAGHTFYESEIIP
jgi:hypothetical protein